MSWHGKMINIKNVIQLELNIIYKAFFL